MGTVDAGSRSDCAFSRSDYPESRSDYALGELDYATSRWDYSGSTLVNDGSKSADAVIMSDYAVTRSGQVKWPCVLHKYVHVGRRQLQHYYHLFDNG